MLERHDIPHSEVEDVNDSAFLDRLRRLSPDLVLSVFPLQRFGPGLLSIPRMGCINVHSAPLPEYRGLHSTFWSLYNGERESGISIHFMNDDWDAGPIIMDRRFPISPGDTVYSLDRRKMAIVPGLLSDALDALIEGRVVTRENDPGKGAYYSVPSRETLLAFRKERGGRWF
jgi:methionyl-tRNA formyltransferase